MLRGDSKLNLSKFWTFGCPFTHILHNMPNSRTKNSFTLATIWARIHTHTNLKYGFENEKAYTGK